MPRRLLFADSLRNQLITLTTASMSSIKMDVKKKSASTGVESRSRDPAHCSFTSLDWFGLLSILVSFSADGDMLSSWRERQASVVASRQPWFYPKLVAYGYFWLSEGGITCNG